jgi:hypothetical protein
MKLQGRASSTIRFIGEAGRTSDPIGRLRNACMTFTPLRRADSRSLVSASRRDVHSRDMIRINFRPNTPLQLVNAPSTIVIQISSLRVRS